MNALYDSLKIARAAEARQCRQALKIFSSLHRILRHARAWGAKNKVTVTFRNYLGFQRVAQFMNALYDSRTIARAAEKRQCGEALKIFSCLHRFLRHARAWGAKKK